MAMKIQCHMLKPNSGQGVTSASGHVLSKGDEPKRKFTELRLRVSRVDHPSALIVRYGSTPGAAELGQSRIAPDTINPLFDIWYDAQIPPVTSRCSE